MQFISSTCWFCDRPCDPYEGCSCTKDLECQCGACDWELPFGGTEPEDLVCRHCDTGPLVITQRTTSRRVARKTYTVPYPEGPPEIIEPGETYLYIGIRGHYKGGRSYYDKKRVKLWV